MNCGTSLCPNTTPPVDHPPSPTPTECCVGAVSRGATHHPPTRPPMYRRSFPKTNPPRPNPTPAQPNHCCLTTTQPHQSKPNPTKPNQTHSRSPFPFVSLVNIQHGGDRIRPRPSQGHGCGARHPADGPRRRVGKV